MGSLDTLLNWLWQGCAVTLAATLTLALSRHAGASTRYALWWTTLLLVLTLPASASLGISSNSSVATVHDAVSVPESRAILTLPQAPPWTGTLLMALWAFWVVVHLSRTALALIGVRRAKRGCRPFPKHRERRLDHWVSASVQGRRAQLAVSDQVQWAAVLGFTTPTIAVAPEALRTLNDEELDAVLLHEWAHVQRHDDVASVIQLLVRAFFGWHPAVRWIDRQLHLEREIACDAWAVSLTKAPKAYAACLVRLAGTPMRSISALPVPGALVSPKAAIRIVRLLDARRKTSRTRSMAMFALTGSSLVAFALVVASVEVVVVAKASTLATRSEHNVASGRGESVRVHALARGDMESASLPVEAQASRTGRGTRDHQPSVASPPVSVVPIIDRQRKTTSEVRVFTDHTVTTPQAPNAVDLQSVLVALGEHLVATEPQVPETVSAPVAEQVSPWGAAADTGIAVGRGSQKAALRTARFFTKISKRIAGAF